MNYNNKFRQYINNDIIVQSTILKYGNMSDPEQFEQYILDDYYYRQYTPGFIYFRIYTQMQINYTIIQNTYNIEDIEKYIDEYVNQQYIYQRYTQFINDLGQYFFQKYDYYFQS